VGTPREYRLFEIDSWQLGRTHIRERANTLAAHLAFAPDSKILAIVQSARVVQLIDPATGQELASLVSPASRRFGHLAFSTDGSRLAAVCADAVIEVWDLRSLRRDLADVSLDWDLPPYPAPDTEKEATPLRVTVDLGNNVAARVGKDVEKQTAAIAKNPDDAEAYFQRGRLFIRLREFSRARDDFNQAIDLKPDHFEAYHQRGHAHEGLGQAQKAIDDFTAALKGQPQNAHLYHARGENYLHLRDYVKAVEDLNRALQFQLTNRAEEARACNNLAWIFVVGPPDFRAPDKALPLARKAVELAPDNWAYCHTLGVAHYRLGQYKEAVEALDRGIKSNKDQATAFDLFILAMCHHHLGDAAKAKDCYDRARNWIESKKDLPPQSVAELRAFSAEAEAEISKK
jgi:tetratricopeptide (TPR) repeat protein